MGHWFQFLARSKTPFGRGDIGCHHRGIDSLEQEDWRLPDNKAPEKQRQTSQYRENPVKKQIKQLAFEGRYQENQQDLLLTAYQEKVAAGQRQQHPV